MAQPGILSSQIPPGEDHVMRALADIRREMRELGPSIMHSFQSVVDELAAHQATLDATVADIAANVASINTLIMKVVTPAVVNSLATNFALSFTQVDLVDASLVVPDGCTRLQVNATGIMTVVNSYGFGNAVDLYIHLDTTYGQIFTASVPTLQTVTVAANFATLATGLTPGATLHLYARAGSLNAITTDTSNAVVLTSTLLWLP